MKEALKSLILSNSKSAETIKKKGVYCLIKQDEIVYIGQTANLHTRLIKHIADRIKTFDSYTFFPIKNKAERVIQEAFLIKTFQPFYNGKTREELGFVSYQAQQDRLKLNWFDMSNFCKKNNIRKQGESLVHLQDIEEALSKGVGVLGSEKQVYENFSIKGELIKRQRGNRSLQAISDASEGAFSDVTLMNWERNEYRPTKQNVAKLLSVLGCTYEDISQTVTLEL